MSPIRKIDVLLPLASIALFTALLVFGGCAAFQVNQVTVGQTILDLGDQFVSMGHLYNQAYEQNLITREQYQKFADFAGYFQKAYPLLVESYTAGTQSPAQLRQTVREISDELSLLAIAELKQVKPAGGK